MTVASNDLFLTQKELDEQRLRNFAVVFGRVDSTLAGRNIDTALASSKNPAPAWSDGQKITFNKERIGDVTDTHNLVSLMGLNYHELAHLLWTPRSYEHWMQNLAQSGKFNAFNMLEDQRIETLLTARYGATKSYLKAVFLEHSLNRQNADYETLHLLSWGRRHLGPQIRQTLADSFRRPDLLQKTKDIIDEYRVIGVGLANNRRAMKLIEDFHAILEDMANDEDGEAAEPSCFSSAQQTQGATEIKEQRSASDKAKSKKDEERDEDEEYVGSSSKGESDGDEDSDSTDSDEQESSQSSTGSADEDSDSPDEWDDDWSTDDDDEEESSDSADQEDDEDFGGDSADEDEEDAGGDADLGDEDQDQSWGDDSEESDESDGSLDSASDGDDQDGDEEAGDSAGDSHGKGEAADGPNSNDATSKDSSESGGDGAGQQGSEVPEGLSTEEVQEILGAIGEELKKAMAESQASIKTVQDNIVRPSGQRIPPANLQRLNGTPTPCAPEMIADSRRVGNEFRRLVNDSDPGWNTHRDSGRINVRRAMHADNYDDVFDQWNEGNQLASDMEVVIGLDVSGSMRNRMIHASRALWVARRAIENIGPSSRVSTFAFTSESYVLSDPGEKALPNQFTAYGSQGSTDPTDMLNEARRIFQMSKKAHKILIMITDGSWARYTYGEDDDNASFDESMQIMNKAGVLTGVLFMADQHFIDNYGSTDLDEMYKLFGHHSKIFEQTQDSNQIKNFAKKMVTLAMKQAR